ncbi:hypothetical protein [Herbiconiux sp. A18JL235]|uniref:Holin n=1 Tax=Herbiconiux sp. A18JL235 TaxID=3152363 RepID=A0AB39BLH5_9MICO
MSAIALTAVATTLTSAFSTVAAFVADTKTPDPDSVTPGIIGFIATFGVAAVTLLLVIDMVRRVRRVNYRAQVREELEAELAAKSAADADGGEGAPGAAPATGDGEADAPGVSR